MFGPLVLLLLLGGFGFKRVIDDVAIQNARSFQREVLINQEDYIELWFEERSDDVARLAKRLGSVLGDREAMRVELARFDAEAPQFSTALFREPDGVNGIRANADGAGIDISDREYFRQTMNGKAAISPVLVGRVSGEPVVVFAHPVFRQAEEVAGMVFSAVTLEHVEEVLAGFRVDAQGETYILRADGTMITESRYEPRLRAQGLLEGESQLNFKVTGEIYSRATNQARSASPYRSYWGERVVGSYRWTNNDRWILVYEQTVDSVLGRYDDTLRVAGLIAFALGVILAIALSRVERTITGPIYLLSRVTQSYFNEEQSTPLQMEDFREAPDELRQLADAFQAMRGRVESDLSRIEHDSQVDALTALANRGHFESEAQRQMNFCSRSALPFSVIMLDLDHFKSINDSLGHAGGDAALRSVAQQLHRTVRESDFVCRYGGEEFAVFVPNATTEQGRELAERIRSDIAALEVSYNEQSVQVTVSAGVAGCNPEHGCRIESTEALAVLVSRADRNLYEAKRSGRNRVVAEDLQEPL